MSTVKLIDEEIRRCNGELAALGVSMEKQVAAAIVNWVRMRMKVDGYTWVLVEADDSYELIFSAGMNSFSVAKVWAEYVSGSDWYGTAKIMYLTRDGDGWTTLVLPTTEFAERMTASIAESIRGAVASR
jgi:hypothetical protein